MCLTHLRDTLMHDFLCVSQEQWTHNKNMFFSRFLLQIYKVKLIIVTTDLNSCSVIQYFCVLLYVVHIYDCEARLYGSVHH